LGSCFEIFPSFEDAPSDASTAGAHLNPLEATFGGVAVGATAKLHLRYYNFCNDRDATLLGVDLLASPVPGAAALEFAITATPAVGANIGANGTLDITFTPKASGLHEAWVRYRVSHGDYETHIKGGK
jgi:hypothetical protein